MKLDNLNTLIKEFSVRDSSLADIIHQRWMEMSGVVWLDYEPSLKPDFNLKEHKLQLQILNLENSTAVLRQMKNRLAALVSSLIKLEQQFLDYITFLFGLSSSQSSFIFHAFSGVSLCRTPNL